MSGNILCSARCAGCDCHSANQHKEREDEFKRHECSARYPHVEPPADCALEELNLWLVENALPEDARDWLLEWANRRAANVIEFLAEPMAEIATMEPSEAQHGTPNWRQSFITAQFVARCALRTCAIPTQEK